MHLAMHSRFVSRRPSVGPYLSDSEDEHVLHGPRDTDATFRLSFSEYPGSLSEKTVRISDDSTRHEDLPEDLRRDARGVTHHGEKKGYVRTEVRMMCSRSRASLVLDLVPSARSEVLGNQSPENLSSVLVSESRETFRLL